MTIHPVQVQGAWRLGWALDVHTISSEFLGYDQNGNPQFDTTRSPLGELLYQLKYRGQNTATQVAAVMVEFFDDKPIALSRIDIIVPMPASTVRAVQPVAEVAKSLGKNSRSRSSSMPSKRLAKHPDSREFKIPKSGANYSTALSKPPKGT